MEINLAGLNPDDLNGILFPFADPSNAILNDERSEAILIRVAQAIHLNNKQISIDLAKAGVLIPD